MSGEPGRASRGRAGNLRAMAGLIASRAVIVGAGFLTSVLWANSFDADTYGRYQIVIAASAIVANFCLTGLNDAALISAARGFDGNLARIVRLRIAAAIVGALVLATWGVVRYRGADPIMMAAFLVGAATFVPLQLQPLWQAFVNGKARYRALTTGQIAFAVSSLAALGGAVLLGATEAPMLPWVMLASLGAMALVALGLHASLRGLATSEQRDPGVVRYGHHVTAAMALSWAFSSDRLIVGELLSPADTAVLAIALVLPNQAKVLFSAFEQVFLPRVTAAASVTEAWAYSRPRLVRLWLIYVALGVVGFVLLPVVIPLFFSEKYVAAAPYAKWLWLSLCSVSPATFLASILNAQRDRRFLYLKNLAGPALTLGLFFLLIPRYGIVGAIAARIANHVFLAILNASYFVHVLRRERRDLVQESLP